MVAARIAVDDCHVFWNEGCDVHTEENIGIDENGIRYGAGDSVLVIVHGGGLLSPERVISAYESGSTLGGSVRYKPQEFNDLLEGKLSNGDNLDLFELEDIKKGVLDLPHRFGIVMPYSKAVKSKTVLDRKKDFLTNDLVIARLAGCKQVENYYERMIGVARQFCVHVLPRLDPNIPQGRFLFLPLVNNKLNNVNYRPDAMCSGNVYDSGLFYGVRK